MVEGGAVLEELLLADALGVTRQDLVLDLVDGSGDGGQQLLPTHTEVLQGRRELQRKVFFKCDVNTVRVYSCSVRAVLYLHCVRSVLVVEDEGLLDELVVSLQRVDFRLVRNDGVLIILQAGQLILQSAVHLNGYPSNFLPTQKHSVYFPVCPTNVALMLPETESCSTV